MGIFIIPFLQIYTAQSQKLDTAINYPSTTNNGDFIIKAQTTAPSGNHYLLGTFQTNFTLNKKKHVSLGYHDLFFFKTDSRYNTIWVHTLGSLNDDIPGSIEIDDSESVYFSGYLFETGYLDYNTKAIQNKYSSSYSYNFIIKFDSAGNKEWNHFVGSGYNRFGVSNPDPSSDFPIKKNNKGSLVATSYFRGDYIPYTYNPKYDSVKKINLPYSTQGWALTFYDLNGNLKFIKYFIGGIQYTGINHIFTDNDGAFYINQCSDGPLQMDGDTIIKTNYVYSYISNALISIDNNGKLLSSKFIPTSSHSLISAAEWDNDSNIISFGYNSWFNVYDSALYVHNNLGVNVILNHDKAGKLKQMRYSNDTNIVLYYNKLIHKKNSNEYFLLAHCGFKQNNYINTVNSFKISNNSNDYILLKLDSNLNNIWSVKIKGLTTHYLYAYNSFMDIKDNKCMGMDCNASKGIIYITGLTSPDSLRVYFNNDSNLVYTSPNLNSGSMVLAISDSNFVGIGPLPSRLCRGQSYSMPVAARAAFGTNNKFTLYITPADSIIKNTDSIAFKQTIIVGDNIYFTVPNNITGKYKLTLHSDSVSLWSNQLEVFIDSMPTVSVSASKNPACIGDSVLLVAVHSHAGKWWLPGNKKPVAKDSIWVVAKSTNNYIYECNNGGCIIYDTLKLKVNPQVIADAGRDTTTCKNNYYLMLGNGGVNYMWSNGVNSAFNYVQITNDTAFQLTVSDSIGCSATDSINFKILPLPSVSRGGASKKLFCPTDDSIILLAGSPAGGVFGGNGVKGNCFYPKLSGAGKHIISYNITGGNGCTNSATDIIQVSKAPLALINVTGITRECEGDSLTLFNADTTNYKKFLWSTGDTTVIIKARKTADYTLTVTDTQGCTAISPSQNLVFNPTPSVYISYINGKLKCISSPAAKAWLWRLDGNQLPNDTNDEISNPVKGTYGVKITDINGCIGYSAAYVFTGLYNIPGNDYYIVYDHAAKTIYIYNCTTNSPIKMIDASGRLIFNGTSNGNPTIIEMSSCAPGLYNIICDKGTFKVVWW